QGAEVALEGGRDLPRVRIWRHADRERVARSLRDEPMKRGERDLAATAQLEVAELRHDAAADHVKRRRPPPAPSDDGVADAHAQLLHGLRSEHHLAWPRR